MYCSIGFLLFLLAPYPDWTQGVGLNGEASPEDLDSSDVGQGASECSCAWTEWMNNNDYHPLVGDDNSYENLRRHYDFCDVPSEIQCRSVRNPEIPAYIFESSEVKCNLTVGLVCKSRSYDQSVPLSEQSLFYCSDYELRVKCCVCPEKPSSTAQAETTANTDNATATNLLFADDIQMSPNATNSSTPTEKLQHVLPVYIIIVIILATLIIFGIIICVVRWRAINRKMTSKHSHHYVGGHLDHFQRPVSFTEVDNHISEPSSLSRSSLGGSYRPERFNKFDQGQLMFLQSDPMREQRELINSSPASGDSLARRDEDVPRRWFPDEHGQNLERQGGKSSGRNWIARAFAPTQKNIPFMDDAQGS